MILTVPREKALGEHRVAVSPEVAAQFIKLGHTVRVERSAGIRAGFADLDYIKAGAEIHDEGTLYKNSRVVLRVRPPDYAELALIPRGALLVAFLAPFDNPWYIDILASAGITALSMDSIPCGEQAHAIDAVTSLSIIAGYKAVILAANLLPRFFAETHDAVGDHKAAEVFILGSGSAAIEAILTAIRLGANVTCFDFTSINRSKIESTGATFLDMSNLRLPADVVDQPAAEDKKKLLSITTSLSKMIAEADVVICTVQKSGERAPVLITEEAVRQMRPGSIIIDLVASSGGNCQLTVSRETVIFSDITIVGAGSLASTIPKLASELYALNIFALLTLLVDRAGSLKIDLQDPIVKQSCLTYMGQILHAATRSKLRLPKYETDFVLAKSTGQIIKLANVNETAHPLTA